MTRKLCGQKDGAETPTAASGSLAEGTPGNIPLIFTVKTVLLLLFSIIIIITLTELHGNEDKHCVVLGADHLNSWFIGEESEPQRGTGFAKFTQGGRDLVQGPSSRSAPRSRHQCGPGTGVMWVVSEHSENQTPGEGPGNVHVDKCPGGLCLLCLYLKVLS